MKSKQSHLNRILDFYASRGVNCERANKIKHKIIFAKFNNKS